MTLIRELKLKMWHNNYPFLIYESKYVPKIVGTIIQYKGGK